MDINLCMLFDKNYLTRGVAAYTSLAKYSPNFRLWILCMDQESFGVLKKLELRQVELLRLEDIEDEVLKEVKKKRTFVEYCWTLSPILPSYILDRHPEIDSIGYLDSDVLFFSSPEPIYKEMGDDSVLIIRHNYSENLRFLQKKSGVYNVSLVIFKNDERGKKCLSWWKERCVEWCHAYYEDGKLGDQMYLDDWTERFDGVHVLKHKGANVAPWNINRYILSEKNGSLFVDEDPLIFYHYHSFKLFSEKELQRYNGAYIFSSEDEEYIYPTYERSLKSVNQMIQDNHIDFSYGYSEKPSYMVRIKNATKKYLRTLCTVCFKLFGQA